MPRKAPDKVIEHRITLGNYERNELSGITRNVKGTNVANSVGNVLQGVTFPVLGAAALLFVGFSLDDLIDNTKNYIDRLSDYLANTAVKQGIITNTAPAIGIEITETELEKAKLYQEYVEALNNGTYTFNSTKAKNVRAKLERLETREQILRQMLDDIATGKRSGVGYGFVLGRTDSLGGQQALQQFYEEYGGEGDFDQ